MALSPAGRALLLLPAWLLHGLVMQALAYAGQHETMHGTAFKTRWVNSAVSFLVSMPGLEFAAHERLMHKDHHTWTQDPSRDPELTSDFGPLRFAPGFLKAFESHREYWEQFVCLHRPVVSHVGRLFNCARGVPVDYSGWTWSMPRDPAAVRGELQSAALLQLAVYAVVVPAAVRSYGAVNVLCVWLIPAVLGFGPISFLRNGEHGACGVDSNGLTNTRTTATWWPVRFLLWNMNFHAEHHLYTAVPFHALPKLHEHLKDRLENKSPSFTAVNRAMYREWIPAQRKAVDSWEKAGKPQPKVWSLLATAGG